ncbi:16S rRNA (guanine(527)-N(7))-methyltransferase RsmG [Pelagibius sp. CAU 1746]|uniref:16S rRNA (guanine(527)-N(7))-methyltransferase RsmG n=1 Tax=Pelagibius sp. CAU 1746 TaxID=3140370 RepID=UPI00325AC8EA
MSPEEFRDRLAVSRETLDRFLGYAALLAKWNAAINLVSPRSLDDLWRRHFLDSAQLRDHLPETPGPEGRVILDVGAGAGFPGMVLALLGCGVVHLVEADQRKAQFLREVARVTGAPVEIHPLRVESPALAAALPAVDVVTCRAFAPLPRLLALTERFLVPKGGDKAAVGLFLKGRRVDEELTEAGKKWRLQIDRFESETDPEGSILRLKLLSLGDGAS